jgi:electron transfer flavoprotein beta subunit
MNVICCLARVPDTATRIRVASDGKSPDFSGAQFVINPFDDFALEEAVRLKEKGGGTLVVIHVGPVDFQKDLRQSLAKGGDRAIQIQTEGPLGPQGIAQLLADAIRPLMPATVFCGKQSVDGDVGATGAMLAGLLGIPVITKASTLKIEGNKATATREIEGGIETVEAELPCVITAEKGLNEPRRAGLKEIMAAKNKPLEVKKTAAPPPKLEVLKLELPPERAPGKIVGEGVAAVATLVNLLKNEAKVL